MKKEKRSDFRTRNSRKLYIPLYIMAIVLVFIIFYIKISGKPLDETALKLAVVFIIAIIIATEIHRLGNSYEISENSVVHRKGYLTIISKRIEFGAISDVDVRQNLWQRLLAFGDVEIFKFSEKSVIKDINKPFKFVDILGDRIRGVRGRVR